MICPNQFGDAPGLGETTFGFMRGVTIKYLAGLSEAAIISQMLQERLDKSSGFFLTFSAEPINFQICLYKRPNHKRPNCTLVIGLIALPLWAGVRAFITAVLNV